jgi:hypothetical protein
LILPCSWLQKEGGENFENSGKKELIYTIRAIDNIWKEIGCREQILELAPDLLLAHFPFLKLTVLRLKFRKGTIIWQAL